MAFKMKGSPMQRNFPSALKQAESNPDGSKTIRTGGRNPDGSLRLQPKPNKGGKPKTQIGPHNKIVGEGYYKPPVTVYNKIVGEGHHKP